MPERTDSERMDWLEGQCSGTYTGTVWEVTGEVNQDIRSAIDAAIFAQTKVICITI